MLIRCTVSNFLSFKEPTTLDLLASSERIHPQHVLRSKRRTDPNLLRFGVVYGANAAGKSNLVKALRFVKDLVTEGRGPDARIPVQRFRLDPAYQQQPATFRVEFRYRNKNYIYSLAVEPRRIVQEELMEAASKSETLLFRRTTSPEDAVAVEFGPFEKQLDAEHRAFLGFIARGTRPNQTFLGETVEHNDERFRPAFVWLRDVLLIVDPSSVNYRTEAQIATNDRYRRFVSDFLIHAGTGITQVQAIPRSIDVYPLLSPSLIDDVRSRLPDNHIEFIYDHATGNRFAIMKEAGELYVLQTTTHHGDATFQLLEESDGTQRLFDLLPLVYGLVAAESEQVVVVDEIGRSLHPHLTQLIVDRHLAEANADKPTQLLITTHETNLLDLDILRRDEIWFAEKRRDGSTDLYSLSDFQPRYDKDIRRDYLVGRYGAIPFIGGVSQLQPAAEEHDAEPADAA